MSVINPVVVPLTISDNRVVVPMTVSADQVVPMTVDVSTRQVAMTVAATVQQIVMNVAISAQQVAMTVGVAIVAGLPEHYEGQYEFIPGDEVQTINIKNMMADADIIIDPIPSNYGKISWNGSVLTVS